jgi:8-oxo-dGTP diphosphatase
MPIAASWRRFLSKKLMTEIVSHRHRRVTPGTFRLDTRSPTVHGVTVYLIRHAHAGDRGSWPSDDRLRPLSRRGFEQAERIADAIAGQPIEVVRSSPAIRCLQTVAPLARARMCPVDSDARLFEGSDAEAVLALIDEFTDEQIALCSHGDVIPELIDVLRARGVPSQGRGCEKGSIWRLDRDGKVIVGAVYLGRP